MTTQATDAAEKPARPKETAVIVVNAQEHDIDSLVVSHEAVVQLAYPTPPAPDTRYTVTYRKAKEPHHEGSLAPGQSVEVKKKGTIFNVTPTSKS